MRRRRSIRGLLIALVLTVALPLFGVLTWGFSAEVRRQHREASDLTLRIARSIAGDMGRSIDRSHDILTRMAQRPTIRAVRNGECDSLFAIVDFFPDYLDLVLYDRFGRSVCSATPAAADAPFVQAIEPLVVKHLASKGESENPLMLHVRGRWISVFFKSVNEGGLTLALVQYADLDIDTYPNGTIITILDRHGRVIARTLEPEKWLGRFIPASDPRRLAMINSEGRFEGRGLDGVKRQGAFARVRGTDWVVFAGVPTGTAMAAVRSLIIHGATAGAVVVGIVLVFALKLYRAIERPLNVLARAAQRIGQEGFFSHIPTDGPSEIASVATEFNRMVESRAEAERALIDSRNRLEALSAKLLEVQEDERRHIAREIHDELGQLLTALNMDIGGLMKSVHLTDDQQAMAQRIRQALDQTTASVQRISAEIRPAALDDFGLVAAIESDVRRFEQRTGIECELFFDDENLSLGAEADAAIYRVVQEAMTNIARHSNATRMEIRLRQRGDELLVDTRDYGRGITPAEIGDRRSLGLLGMRERARGLGATLDIEGIDGGGTIISLRIPHRAATSRNTA